MAKRDPRVDAYIAKSRPFARPILAHLRKLVRAGCPEVVETIKWSMPAFEFNGPLAGMGAFKEHAVFGFWKGALLADGKTPLGKSTEKAMGQFGCLYSVGDLPSDRRMVALVRRAEALNRDGVQRVRNSRPTAPVRVPAWFRAALAKSPKALATFRSFSPSHQREYVAWVTEAKTAPTRKRRLETAVTWMSQGRVRHWKHIEK